MKNDLKVSFYLKKNEADSAGIAFIMGRIRIGKTETSFSVREKVSLLLWDTRSGRALGKSKEASLLNRKLDSINGLINARYMEQLKTKKNVTPAQLKSAFQGVASQQSMLIEYFENYVVEYEKRVGKDRQISTYQELNNSLNHLRKFLKKKYKLQDIPFLSLTNSFIEDYDYYLRINLGLSLGTILGIVSRLRRIVKYAINEGILSNDPFFGYKPDYPKAKQKYLTLTELESIINTSFEKSHLHLAKDMFLFSCFTGLAYTDIRNLSEENIVKTLDGMLWIKTKRQKTGVSSNIPLLEIPIQIIERYRGTAKNNKLLPMASSSALNNSLKTIAKQCGIERNLIFHAGRHTYASTITLSQGVPIESVSSMLGHKTLNTTNIYAKITNEKVADEITLLEMKIGNKYELTQLESEL